MAFQPPKIDFTFFSDAHGIFSRIDHIVGHKSGFGKFLKIEIISNIFSDHSFIRLDSNYRKKNLWKTQNLWTLIYWQPHCRDGIAVIHRSSALLLVWMRLQSTHGLKVICISFSVKCLLLSFAHSVVFISSIFRSALYLRDLHFDFNKY